MSGDHISHNHVFIAQSCTRKTLEKDELFYCLLYIIHILLGIRRRFGSLKNLSSCIEENATEHNRIIREKISANSQGHFLKDNMKRIRFLDIFIWFLSLRIFCWRVQFCELKGNVSRSQHFFEDLLNVIRNAEIISKNLQSWLLRYFIVNVWVASLSLLTNYENGKQNTPHNPLFCHW